MLSAICLNLDQPEILSSGNGLRTVSSESIIWTTDKMWFVSREIAGYKHFSPSPDPDIFSKASSLKDSLAKS